MVSSSNLGLILLQIGTAVLLLIALIELIAHERRRSHRQAYESLVGEEYSILLPRDRSEGTIRNGAGEVCYTIKTAPPARLRAHWHPHDFELIDTIGKLVATKQGGGWFFIYGFEKSDKANLSNNEFDTLQSFAKELLARSGQQLHASVADGSLQEICHGKETEG